MAKIKIIKKKMEDSIEYEIGDIFEVAGTWYGGVHIAGKSGIPVSLDREEYEEIEEEEKIVLREIPGLFSVCKVEDYSQVNLEAEFCFIGKTDEEKSVVCLTEDVPANTTDRDDNWRAFRIQGVLDFSLIGILSKISTCLAEKQVGIFAVSTYNTDYILTKENDFKRALNILRRAGYEVE